MKQSPLILTISLFVIWLFSIEKTNAQVYINEVMFDPTPNRGIEISTEYIELYNASNTPITIKDATLKDAKNEVKLQEFHIEAKGYLLLLPPLPKNTEQNSEQKFIVENSISIHRLTRWLSLNNDKEILHMEHPTVVIAPLNFNFNDWKNTDYKNGGYALSRSPFEIEYEYRNSKQICEVGKWQSSTAPLGGTPGMMNHIENTVSSDLKITLTPSTGFISINLEHGQIKNLGSFEYKNKHSADPLYSTLTNNTTEWENLEIKFEYADEVWRSTKSHTEFLGQSLILRIKNLVLCAGTMQEETILNIIFPKISIASQEIIISEIMYNPLSERAEFLELTNLTQTNISLKNMDIQQFTDDGLVLKSTFSLIKETDSPSNTANPISPLIIKSNNDTKNLLEHLIIPPRSSIILTKNKSLLIAQFKTLTPEKVLDTPSFFTLPNGGGQIKLMYKQILIDEISYGDEFHSAFLKEKKGISLSRRTFLERGLYSTSNYSNATPGIFVENIDEKESNSSETTPLLSTSFLNLKNNPIENLTIRFPQIQGNKIVTMMLCTQNGIPIQQIANQETSDSKSEWYFSPYNYPHLVFEAGRYIITGSLVSESGDEENVFFKKVFVLYH